MNEGYSAMLLIVQLHDKLVEAEELTDKQKSIIAEKLAVSSTTFVDYHNMPPPNSYPVVFFLLLGLIAPRDLS